MIQWQVASSLLDWNELSVKRVKEIAALLTDSVKFLRGIKNVANDTLIQPCTGDLSLLPTVISLPTWHLPKSLNTVSSTTADTIVHAEGNETVGPPVFAVLAIRSNQ